MSENNEPREVHQWTRSAAVGHDRAAEVHEWQPGTRMSALASVDEGMPPMREPEIHGGITGGASLSRAATPEPLPGAVGTATVQEADHALDHASAEADRVLRLLDMLFPVDAEQPSPSEGVGAGMEQPDPEFADVDAALDELRAAVEGAVQNDLFQLEQLLGQIRAQYPTVVPLIQNNLGDAQTRTRDAAMQQLQAVEEFTRQELGKHRDVPAKLEAQAEEVQNIANRFSHMSKEVRALAEKEGWTGEAAEGYKRVVTVQANALVELGGMKQAAVNAMNRAALLNRAAFFYTAETIRFTAQQIQGPQLPCLSTEMFLGTQSVEGELRALLGKLQRELHEMSNGETIKILSDELAEVLESPAVLQPSAWPTGGQAADTPPESTANVVRMADEPYFHRPTEPVEPGFPRRPEAQPHWGAEPHRGDVNWDGYRTGANPGVQG